jgi:uncharacterized protein YbjT (DUF2867 family)
MRIAVAGGTGTVGRHVVAHAQNAGHDVVVLSRSRGVDVRSGEGLADALHGADAVIDVTHPDTIEQGAATEFWTDVAGSLQRTGAELGAEHIVTLSIVGIEKTSFGYYLPSSNTSARQPTGRCQARCSGRPSSTSFPRN